MNNPKIEKIVLFFDNGSTTSMESFDTFNLDMHFDSPNFDSLDFWDRFESDKPRKPNVKIEFIPSVIKAESAGYARKSFIGKLLVRLKRRFI